MSLQDIRAKTQTCLTDIYTALEEKLATIPEQRNLVNVSSTIRSIESGEVPTPEPTQVHNYLMLYDGTLGEAGENGANVCSNVTGGLSLLTKAGSGTISYENNRIVVQNASSTSNIGDVAVFVKNKIDISEYKTLASIDKYSSNLNFSFGVNVRNAYAYNNNSSAIASSTSAFNHTNTTDINKKYIAWAADFNASEGYPYLGTFGPSLRREIYAFFLVKQDNYQSILDLAGITTTYTDEASICADSTAMTTILNNKEAVEYMIYNCTGTFMLAFIQSETALSTLNKSDYRGLVYGNDVWFKFLSMIA